MFTGSHVLRRVLALLALVSFHAPGVAAGGEVHSGSIPAQPAVEVSIKDYHFLPPEVRIKAGDTVKWTNHEKRTSHSVLFAAENGLESERLFPDESWQRTFSQPGTYNYRCGPHEEMMGVVIVE